MSMILRTAAAILATVGCCGDIVATAHAQAAKDITIPAGELNAALETLVEQTGVQLLYDLKKVEGLRTSGVAGAKSAEAAVIALLKGTPLTTKKDASGAILIAAPEDVSATKIGQKDSQASAMRLARVESDAATDDQGTVEAAKPTSDVPAPSAQSKDSDALEEISVYGRRPDDTVRDIPQSIAVFNQEVMAITPTVTVGDMIRFVPTASRNGSTLNAFGDNYIIRGFDASQTVNGLGFNRVAHARDTAGVERIEVLKGPASVLYGQMQPGAVINVVTKQPLDHFQSEIGLEYGRYDDRRYTVDVTGPISQRVKARLNLAYRDAETFVDFWDLDHLYVAPNVTVDLTSATTLTLEGAYSTNTWGSFQNGTPAQGMFLPNPNGKYRRSFNPDEPDIGSTDRNSIDANVRLVHELSDSARIRASYTYTRNEGDFTEMFVASAQPTFSSDFRTLSRRYYYSRGAHENDDNYLLDLVGEVRTGSLVHKYLLGINYRSFDSSRPALFVTTTTLDLFNPVYGTVAPSDPALPDFFQNFDSKGYFFQDRVQIGERLHLLAGFRYTDSHQDTESISLAGVSFVNALDENKWTSQFGALYDVTDTFSVYANRAESFVPQFGTTSGGTPFQSEQGLQYELGTRFDVGNTGLLANAAAFVITKENMRTADPNNPGFSAALGEVEARGVEVSLHGHVTPNWFLGLGYGYTDTEITRNYDGLQGNALRNAPKSTVSAQTRYDIQSGALRGLGFGGTLEHVDSRYGNDANTFELPKHTRIDLALFYSLSERTQVDLLVNNVLNEDIYAEGFNIYRVIPEPRRTFLARFKMRFQ